MTISTVALEGTLLHSIHAEVVRRVVLSGLSFSEIVNRSCTSEAKLKLLVTGEELIDLPTAVRLLAAVGSELRVFTTQKEPVALMAPSVVCSHVQPSGLYDGVCQGAP